MTAAGGRAACLGATLAFAGVSAPGAPAATASPDSTRYAGETEDGRRVKLVADARGEVVRGAITVGTECSADYDPFRARLEFGRPLDRSGPKGFRDKGTFLEEDDRFSGRYKYVVEGERESERVLAGTVNLEITFRRNGKEYTTCAVKALVFSAELVD